MLVGLTDGSRVKTWNLKHLIGLFGTNTAILAPQVHSYLDFRAHVLPSTSQTVMRSMYRVNRSAFETTGESVVATNQNEARPLDYVVLLTQ